MVRGQRYTGYQRLLHRMEVGVFTTCDLIDTDAASTAHAWLAHIAQVLELVKQKDAHRIKGELADTEVNAHWLAELARGMGRRYDPEKVNKLKHALDMVLGIFTSAGIFPLGMRDVNDLADVVMAVLSELDDLTEQKGGIQRLIEEKRRKVYKLSLRRFVRAAMDADRGA